MSSSTGLRFLRPYLHTEVNVSGKKAYIRLYNSATKLPPRNAKAAQTRGPADRETSYGKGPDRYWDLSAWGQPLAHGAPKGAAQERVEVLKSKGALEWPRQRRDAQSLSVEEFREKYNHITIDGHIKRDVYHRLQGRVSRFRVAGTGLFFIDIVQNGRSVQIQYNQKVLEPLAGVSKAQFKEFYKTIQRGDIISVYGNPLRDSRGLTSMNGLELPEILSPCLNSLPTKLDDRETLIRNRHVDLIVHQKAVDTLKARSAIIRHIRDFLLDDNFMEVQTPILADKAGGAIAKPFATSATEFPEKELALRVAPELWLKRLIIGGMDRVFEIGPAFRNEGLDATHNPEFTTCEFYKSYAELEELIEMTESMLHGLVTKLSTLKAWPLQTLELPDTAMFDAPFKRIAFIPGVEAGLGCELPDLSSDDAEDKLIALFKEKDLALPTSTTLPRLLDKLASIYIEPQCDFPTFITHHPACMAPLSKSFLCTQTQQLISARAELFIGKREIANMYEEENSPFAQREKFLQQGKWKDDENKAIVDESYLEALEWGLPPTGGWGAGIDRLVMLFTGAKRISDVLSFGSLKNVVNLGAAGTDKLKIKVRKEKVEEEEVTVDDTKEEVAADDTKEKVL